MPLCKCEFCNQRVPANKLKLHQKRCARFKRQLKKQQLENPEVTEDQELLTEPETTEEINSELPEDVIPKINEDVNQVTEPETKEKKKSKFRGR